MLLNGKVNFVDNAINAECSINGMYVIYTAEPDTTLDVVSSGASLQEVITNVNNSPDTGICRMDSVAVDLLTVSSATTGTVIATTANSHDVAGIPISAGVYVRGAITAHITESPSTDVGFDYTSGGPMVIPANGAVTIIDKVAIE